MAFFIDERDFHFTLFEYLNFGQLTGFDPYREQTEDLYKMVLGEVHKFVAAEVDPIHAKGDRQGCVLKDGQVHVPDGYKEAYQKLAANGILGMDVSASLGGQGLPHSLLMAAFELITGADVSFAMYVGLTRGAAHVIETFGTEKLKQQFCVPMYAGQWAGTMCLTEPGAGSAVGDLKTKATPQGDGTFLITGNKIFISSGDHQLTENIIHLVLARVEGDPAGTKGISLFAVPKIWVNDAGGLGVPNDVQCVNVEHKMGIKAQSTCSLNFGEKGQCRGYLIGSQSQGMKYMFKLMNEARLLTGMQGMALAGCAYENARRYALERIQGGGQKIIEYPDVRRNLALCKAWVEGMRGLLYKTALCIDLSEIVGDALQAKKLRNYVELTVPVCKAYCSDFGFKVTELAMQVYGGYGYIAEYPMEQYMRDAKIASIYEGTNGIQALDLMGRKLPKEGGKLFREFYEDTVQLISRLQNLASLKEAAQNLQQALDTVAQVAMKMAEHGMGGKTEMPMLSATPFLEMCGHVMVARVLLEQAEIADGKTKEGNSDRFYANKIKTACFFASQILPLTEARSKGILSGDRSALDIDFT